MVAGVRHFLNQRSRIPLGLLLSDTQTCGHTKSNHCTLLSGADVASYKFARAAHELPSVRRKPERLIN
jgi:hypothetical protein